VRRASRIITRGGFIPRRNKTSYFFAPAALYKGVGDKNNRRLLMKSGSIKLVTILALMISIFPASRAMAGNDDMRQMSSGEFKFTGTVEQMPEGGPIGQWRIAQRTVHVSGSTYIEESDGRLSVGALVKVEGFLRGDGSIDAKEMEVERSGQGGGNGGGNGNDDNSRPGTEFKGTIESFPNSAGFIGEWRVGGRAVNVTSSTRIETEHGPVAVGAFVEVKGSLNPDGSMNATKIETKSNVNGGDGRDELKGVIGSLPSSGLVGDWTVAGRTVRVTSSTSINQEHGAAVVGAFVEVHGAMRSDGSIDATRIEVNPGGSNDNGGGSGSGGGNANFKGRIESLPASGFVGEWTIGGRTVHVLTSTRLKTEHGPLALGVRVKVKGIRMADGSIVATRIQVKD
jgi:hypothetical protein